MRAVCLCANVEGETFWRLEHLKFAIEVHVDAWPEGEAATPAKRRAGR